MITVATLLEQEKQELARTITLEMGKLFRDSVAEIEKCARGCRYYGENAERFLEDEPAQTMARRSYLHYEPIGTGPGDHAVEFSVLAGVPIRCAGVNGRQCRDS